MNRLKEKYETEITKKLRDELGIKNKMALPRVTKVVVNMGIGDTLKNKEALAQLKKDFMAITGQAPSIRAARVSVASFAIRRGMHVGLKVTLRGDRMYSFLDKLFSIVFPRLRDFRGIPVKGFDKDGNFTIGFEEHTVFPEIDVAKSQPHGLEVTIVTKSGQDGKSFKLLTLMGMPFEK